MTKSVNADPKQKPAHLWAKGQSGNPKGKPQGARHKTTQVMESILGQRSQDILNAAIEAALGGDVAAQRLCLERLMPPTKDRPIRIDLGGLDDLVEASQRIVRSVSDGELTPDEGERISGLLERHRRLVELSELEQRVSLLEQQRDGGTEHEPISQD